MINHCARTLYPVYVTRYNRLYNQVHRVNKHPTSCTTDWMFVYTIKPAVQPVLVVSCKQIFNQLTNRLHRVNGVLESRKDRRIGR